MHILVRSDEQANPRDTGPTRPGPNWLELERRSGIDPFALEIFLDKLFPISKATKERNPTHGTVAHP
jgi:hypothetical protein